MRTACHALLAALLIAACSNQRNSGNPPEPNPALRKEIPPPVPETMPFTSLLDIDSVARADKSFPETVMDSIFVRDLRFAGLYLGCYKAVVRKPLYASLERTDSPLHQAILAIHTAHEISVGGVKFGFGGLGSFGCSAMAESSHVSIQAKVLSLHSAGKPMGKIVLLVAIQPESEQER